jgi:hypothetical protein
MFKQIAPENISEKSQTTQVFKYGCLLVVLLNLFFVLLKLIKKFLSS